MRASRRRSERPLRLSPVGAGGVDLFTNPTLLRDDQLSRGENIDLSHGDVRRRRGMRKVAAVTGRSGAVTFGADTKYLKIDTATQLKIPKGSWAVRVVFVAARPAGGQTAFVLSSDVGSKGYGPISIKVSDAGVVTGAWRKESDESEVSVSSSALADDSDAFVWMIFDADAASTYLYVNGVLAATNSSSQSSDDQPMQDATDWYLGVQWNPGGAAVVANTHFDGKVDGFLLKSFPGAQPGSGTPSLIDTITTKGAFQEWPDPAAPSVLACYDFNEGSGTVAYDWSRFKNHGTYTGSPTFGSKVALDAFVGNYVGVLEDPNGELRNVIGVSGNEHHEVLKGANA